LAIVPLAIWSSKLSNEDLFEAVRLYCGINHQWDELVVESCYLYCYAIKLLIVEKNCSSKEAYQKTMEESARRARISGFSTIKFWIENEVEIGI
jgi:hypothetical protein